MSWFGSKEKDDKEAAKKGKKKSRKDKAKRTSSFTSFFCGGEKKKDGKDHKRDKKHRKGHKDGQKPKHRGQNPNQAGPLNPPRAPSKAHHRPQGAPGQPGVPAQPRENQNPQRRDNLNRSPERNVYPGQNPQRPAPYPSSSNYNNNNRSPYPPPPLPNYNNKEAQNKPNFSLGFSQRRKATHGVAPKEPPAAANNTLAIGGKNPFRKPSEKKETRESHLSSSDRTATTNSPKKEVKKKTVKSSNIDKRKKKTSENEDDTKEDEDSEVETEAETDNEEEEEDVTSSDSKGSSDTTTPVQKEKGKSLDMFSVLAGFSNKQIGEYFKQPYQTNTHHASDENLDKCRFQDVHCLDSTRVILQEGSRDFIHASRVPLADKKELILTQLPMYNTVSEFWSMIWQEKASTVVLFVTNEEWATFAEHIQLLPKTGQCFQGPGGLVFQNQFEVKAKPDFVLKVIGLERGNERRQIRWIQYTKWKHNEAPTDMDHLWQVQSYLRKQTHPVVVSSLSGIGRAASYALLELLHAQLHENKLEASHIPRMVFFIRSHRMGGLQSPSQLKFIFNSVVKHYENKDKKN